MIKVKGTGGGVNIKNATASAGDVLSGQTFFSGASKDIQTGTLALSGNATAADVLSGKTFYNTNAKSKVTGTMPSKAAATYTPTTSNQTIAAGQYLSGAQTIAGDADLKAANIKTGVNLFGVAGTFTSDATAAAAQILSGYTAYSKGSKLTGTRNLATLQKKTGTVSVSGASTVNVSLGFNPIVVAVSYAYTIGGGSTRYYEYYTVMCDGTVLTTWDYVHTVSCSYSGKNFTLGGGDNDSGTMTCSYTALGY